MGGVNRLTLSSGGFFLAYSKRPCTWGALSFILAILAGESLPKESQGHWALLAVVGTTLAWAISPRASALIVLAYGVGFLRHHQLTAIRDSNDLRLILGGNPKQAIVEGWIAHPPRIRVERDGDHIAYRGDIVLSMNHIEIGSRSRPATGLILIRVRGPDPIDLTSNTPIKASGVLRRPAGPSVPGGFNRRRYLRFLGIHYEMEIPERRPALQVSGEVVPPTIPSRFQSWARQTLARGQPPDHPATRLLSAMVLGWRAELNPEARTPFMQSGTLHLFAISGLHVALIAGLMVVLAKCSGIPRRHAGFLIIPALWLYTLATGSPASAVRASTVSTIVLLGWMLKRPPDALNSLGAAAISLLLVDPLQLFQPGFQLSFTVVTCISLVFPKLHEFEALILRRESLTPKSMRSGFRACLSQGIQKILSAFSLSLSAWLGSLPLIATYFHLFTPIGLLANLLLVPLAGLTLASSMMALLLVPCFSPLTEIANSSAWFWMESLITLSQSFAAVPGGHWFVPEPPLSLHFVYYSTLIGWSLSRSSRMTQMVLLTGSTALLLGLAHTLVKTHQETRISILPIPEGDGIFIDQPGIRSDWMIDGGPAWCQDAYVNPFLRALPLTARFENHLLTHGDKKHLEWLAANGPNSDSSQIVVSPIRYRSTFYRSLISSLESDGYSVRKVSAPQSLGKWTILHPRPDTKNGAADEAPLVLLGEINKIRILLISDLARHSQQALLIGRPDLEVDIICLGLPANSAPANPHVLGRLNPRIVIVTGSATQKGTRWVDHLRQSFHSDQTRILFTGTEGAITIVIRHGQTTIQPMRGRPTELVPR